MAWRYKYKISKGGKDLPAFFAVIYVLLPKEYVIPVMMEGKLPSKSESILEKNFPSLSLGKLAKKLPGFSKPMLRKWLPLWGSSGFIKCPYFDYSPTLREWKIQVTKRGIEKFLEGGRGPDIVRGLKAMDWIRD